MTPNGDGDTCKVERACFDFEQHEKVEQFNLGEILKAGMIVKENAKLAELCKGA